MPYMDIVFLVAGTTFYAKCAHIEERSPVKWGLLSALAWSATFFVFGGGFVTWLIGQVLVYVGLFIFNIVQDMRRERG